LVEKPGTIWWGADVKAAYLATVDLISRAEEAIEHRAKGRVRFGGVAVPAVSPEERRRLALALAPGLRGLVGRDRRVVMTFHDAADVLGVASSPEPEPLSPLLPPPPTRPTPTHL